MCDSTILDSCLIKMNILSSYPVPTTRAVLCVNDNNCWSQSHCPNDYGAVAVDGFASCHHFPSIPTQRCFYTYNVIKRPVYNNYCNNQAVGFYNVYNKTCNIYNASVNVPNYMFKNYVYKNNLYVILDKRVDYSSEQYTCTNNCDKINSLTNHSIFVYDGDKLTLNFSDIPCGPYNNGFMIGGIIFMAAVIASSCLYNYFGYDFWLKLYPQVPPRDWTRLIFTLIIFLVLFCWILLLFEHDSNPDKYL